MVPPMSGKKKIIFLEYFPLMAGGQAVLLRLLKHFKRDYDIRVLLFNHGPIEKELEGMKIPVDFIQAPKKVKYRYFWDFIPFNKKTAQYLEQQKPDLVYASGYFAVKLIAPAVKKLNIPLIWHKHQIIERAPYSYLSRQVRYLSSYASKIICVSEASRISMIKSGADPAKTFTVHNGMEIPKISAKALRDRVRRRHNIGKKFLCGTVGYFRRNKGFDTLLRAAHMVKKQDPAIRFIIVGRAESDQAYEKKLHAMQWELELGDTVVFTGKQPKYEYMPAFDLFLLPSYNEPFALVVLESMSVGVPVLSFDSGGTAEAVTDGVNGFILKEMSARSLAAKILELSKNPGLLKRAGKNALATIKKRFTVDRQVREIKNIMESLL